MPSDGKSEDSDARDDDFAVPGVAGFPVSLGKQKIYFQDYHKNISLGCEKVYMSTFLVHYDFFISIYETNQVSIYVSY